MAEPPAATDEAAGHIAGALAIGYVVAIAGEALRTFPLDFLDLLLVATIASANVLRPPPPPAPARRSRRRAAPPPSERVGISRNAVSRALNIPLETVRRRIAVLVRKKVLNEQADGLVFAPDNPLGLGHNPRLADVNLTLLRRLFAGLKANGIRLD
ncbi:MAG: hypothetical protein WDN08_13365 [Rhizomicrobium sp.]